MIFVTVGSQLPFDRLIKGVDSWSEGHSEESVFAQTGDSSFCPQYIEAVPHLSPKEFRMKCETAEVIVSHAGIGNIILAFELQKPLVIMPRLARLKEHRNDHQQATVKLLKDRLGFIVAQEVEELEGAIQKARTPANTMASFSPYASPELIDAIAAFINR